jgi:hypothetical protein
MIFTGTDNVPAHNNDCGLLPIKVVHASFKSYNVTFFTYGTLVFFPIQCKCPVLRIVKTKVEHEKSPPYY